MFQNKRPLSKKVANSWFKLNCEGTCTIQIFYLFCVIFEYLPKGSVSRTQYGDTYENYSLHLNINGKNDEHSD